jgi:Sodium/calcium exchanger protein
MSSALLIVAGLAGLLIGADLLVRGGAALASHVGVRPIVIGLTVVALGTSLPELAIGIDAVRQGSPGLAVGNHRRHQPGQHPVHPGSQRTDPADRVRTADSALRSAGDDRRVPGPVAACARRRPFPGGRRHPVPWWRRVHRRHHLDEPPGVSVGSCGLRVTFRAPLEADDSSRSAD